MDRKITIMHACQWKIYREGLRNVLEREYNIEFIGEAQNGKELMALLEERQPDVVILDIEMPIMDGLHTLALMKEKYPSTKAVIITMKSDRDLIIKALTLGASGYLTQGAGSEEIFAAIRSSFGTGVYCNIGPHSNMSRSFGYLSGIEIKILKLLQKNTGIKIIAQQLGILPRSIEAIVERLKLMSGVTTIEELICAARKRGFIEDEVVKKDSLFRLLFWRRTKLIHRQNV